MFLNIFIFKNCFLGKSFLLLALNMSYFIKHFFYVFFIIFYVIVKFINRFWVILIIFKCFIFNIYLKIIRNNFLSKCIMDMPNLYFKVINIKNIIDLIYKYII